MEDQGEKIVFLAREILNAGVHKTAQKPVHFTMGFKTLCLTTLLAAAGGSVTTAMLHPDPRPLTRYERTEINALVFYAAKINNIDPDSLREDVEKKVGITCLDNLTSSQFPLVRRYLQDKAQ